MISKKKTTKPLKMTEVTTREHSVSSALVFKWHRRFSDSQCSLEEQEGRGRKKKKLRLDDSDVNPRCAGLRQTSDDQGTGAAVRHGLWYHTSGTDGTFANVEDNSELKFYYTAVHVSNGITS